MQINSEVSLRQIIIGHKVLIKTHQYQFNQCWLPVISWEQTQKPVCDRSVLYDLYVLIKAQTDLQSQAAFPHYCQLWDTVLLPSLKEWNPLTLYVKGPKLAAWRRPRGAISSRACVRVRARTCQSNAWWVVGNCWTVATCWTSVTELREPL